METDRSAQWYQAQYSTGPLGQTWMMGSFGPDFGIGEQGVRYQSVDPLTISFISYSITSPGIGIGGPFAGYGRMFSPAALASYGPFAYGNNPQPLPTLGYIYFTGIYLRKCFWEQYQRLSDTILK
ncbi:MAG: hypothetical protein ACMUIU_17220 [bacterium]